MISVFDPGRMNRMKNMIEGMISQSDGAMSSMLGDRIGDMTSLLATLSNGFYGNLALILPLIYIIITANGLIASQVDRGSMAYTLSAPIKRITVVATQGIYMIAALLCMFITISIVGIVATQITQGSVFGVTYTEDVKAVSKLLNMDRDSITNDLTIILNDEQALHEGARARTIDVDVYTSYLEQKLATAADTTQQSTQSEQPAEMQNKIMYGLTAAAEILEMDVVDLASHMDRIKENNHALEAAAKAASLVPDEYLASVPDEAMALEMQKTAFTKIINMSLASEQITLDEGINFDLKEFFMLNLGIFLLMFAISSISFLSSCIFNLAGSSIAFGAGIPIAFFIFQTMAKLGDSMEYFKYLTLNTLYDTSSILSGSGYLIQFIILGAIGVILYLISFKVFKEKDLPL
jgi:ABC-2 type transport system permease protein